jgi:hypothetical protein
LGSAPPSGSRLSAVSHTQALTKWVADQNWRNIAKGNNSFLVYEPVASTEKLVVKIPLSSGNDRLLRYLEFAKKNMGGMTAPFTILRNVSVNGRVYPFAIAQKRMNVDDQDDESAEYKRKMADLFMESVYRGIILDDAVISKNTGLDENGKLYFVDEMLPRDGSKDDAFIPLSDEYYPRITDWNRREKREFYKGWAMPDTGLSDEELYARWGTAIERRRPVEDVNLPETNPSGARLSAAPWIEKWNQAPTDYQSNLSDKLYFFHSLSNFETWNEVNDQAIYVLKSFAEQTRRGKPSLPCHA